MKRIASRVLVAGIFVCALVASGMASTEAKSVGGLYSYVPQMKELEHPKSFCLTPEMKARHQKAVKQMEADIEKYGEEDEGAVEQYRDAMEMIWAALEEPYCGYGTFGLKAIRKSYDKSVNHTRAVFLAAVK